MKCPIVSKAEYRTDVFCMFFDKRYILPKIKNTIPKNLNGGTGKILNNEAIKTKPYERRYTVIL